MSSKKDIEFWKIEAAGNDFLLYLHKKPPAQQLRKEILEACRPHTGVGADGVIYLYFDKHSWHWRFFNSDASETPLCGNAGRAVALWLYNFSLSNKKHSPILKGQIVWRGKLGLFRAQKISSNNKRLELSWSIPKSHWTPLNIEEDLMDLILQLNERGLAGVYLFNVGVPHLVLLGHEAWNEADRMTCNAIFRSHPSLGSQGANVTWIELSNGNALTFERGIERESLSCGSGAIAGFLALREYKKGGEDLQRSVLHFPGGSLEIRIDKENDLWLGGPARIVFQGKLLDRK